MSVNPKDIKLPKGATLVQEPEPEIVLPKGATLLDDSKKKVPTEPLSTGSKNVPAGAASGTTSTTPELKWEDNPLNPAKAAKDFEAANTSIKPSILFKDTDDIKVNELSQKYGAPKAVDTEVVPANVSLNPLNRQYKSVPKNPVSLAIDNANNIEATIKEKIAAIDESARSEKGKYYTPGMYKEKEDLEKDLTEVKILKDKAAARLVPSGDKEVEAMVRVQDPTNSFERLAGWLEPSEDTKPVDTKQKLSPQFTTGLNAKKYTEPVVWERLSEALKTGRPISDSQVAEITALGAKIDAAKLEEAFEKKKIEIAPEQNMFDQYNNQLTKVKTDLDGYEATIKSGKPLSASESADYKAKVSEYNSLVKEVKPIQDKLVAVNKEFNDKVQSLQKVSEDNLLNRPEVLRAFFAEKIGDYLDELGKIKQSAGEAANPSLMTANYFLGHTLNYSDEQIAGAAAEIAKREGIEISDPRVQKIIKELQVNEGWMLGMNSIPKSGGIREFAGGFKNKIADTFKGLDRLAGLGKSADDTYIESQSQGNLDVAQKRLAAEDKGVRGVVNSIVAGAGEFGAQALMMYGAAGVAGRTGKLLSTIETPVLSGAIEGTAANVVGEAGLKLMSNALTKFQNPIGVYVSAKAMSYDNVLKTALSYTSDNEKAKVAAYINSDLEAWTELILSPLDIASGIYNKFTKGQTKDLLKILSDKSLKDDPGKLSAYIQKFLKGAAATGKVALAEIGEEEITQWADYLTNQYLNPESQSFQNRSLQKEFAETAYQTGLTMAVPALLSGIGAAQANTFSKGALLVASQNRQKIVDGLNQDLFDKKIDQQEYNTKVQLVNTAFVAHNQLPPKKANGGELNTNEKANYVWSRTTEAYMEKQMSSTTDAAQKEIWKDKILKQQEYRKVILGLTEEQPEVPEYTIDDKPVSREEFLATAEAEPDDHNFVATNDEEAQQVTRNIGGIDDVVEEKPEETKLPSDAELVNAVEEKKVPGYEKTSITELKEQALQAPDSFKNQFDDEELTVNLIAKNTPEQIENAIKYQQERIENDPNMDEVSMEGIDRHIQLLELGLEKNKQFAELEEKAVELEKEGKPLSKLETLKAKKKLAEVEVPGETVDEKLKHIADKPEGFASELVALAEKRFPKEVPAEKTKPVSSVTTAEQSGKDMEFNSEEKAIIKEEGRSEEEFVSTRNFFKKPYQEEGLPNIGEGKGQEFINDESNAKEETVSVNDLIPTQRVIEKSSIKEKDGNPIIIRNGKDIFVLDGHHRIANEVKNGKTEIKANVYDVTGLEIKTYEQSGKDVVLDEIPEVETHESVMQRAKTGEPIEIDALRIQQSDKVNDDTGGFYGDKGVIEEYQRRQKSGYYGKGNENLFKGDIKQKKLKFENPLVIDSKEEFVKQLAESGDKEALEVMPDYKESDPAKLITTHKTHKDFDIFIAKKAREKGYDGIVTPLEYVDLRKSEQSLSTKQEIKNGLVKKVSAIQKVKEKRNADKKNKVPVKKKEAIVTENEPVETVQEKTEREAAEKQLAIDNKVSELETEKRQKINEVTKPEVDFNMGISNVDLANTTAQNRHDLLDIKARLQSLNQIIKCLWL